MTSGSPLSLLLLGPLGPPHVEDQALAMKERGFDVHVGGNAPPELSNSKLADAGVPVVESPPRQRSTPWGIAATARWVRGLLDELRPSVVHAHWLPGFGAAAALARAAPLTLTAWGSDVYRANRRMRLANRLAIRSADLVMADSQDLIDRCIALGADAERAAVVQWGVDLSAFSPAPGERATLKAKLGLDSGPVILSPRSLMPVYNIPTVVEAFARVGDALPDAQLVLKHMGATSIVLPELPHRDRVHTIGNVAYERMADYYRAADVCVSVTSSDSSPRSVWEAMACGCPCVLSELPWVRELIEPGSDALAVRIEADAVADALISVLTDSDLAGSLARRGRALVERELDRDSEMDRLADLYGRLAA